MLEYSLQRVEPEPFVHYAGIYYAKYYGRGRGGGWLGGWLLGGKNQELLKKMKKGKQNRIKLHKNGEKRLKNSFWVVNFKFYWGSS